MKNSKLLVCCFFIALLCLLLEACKYDIQRFFFREPVIDSRAEFLKDIQSPFSQGENGNIHFAIITDLHFGREKSHMESEVIQSLKNSEAIDFIVLLGDVVETGSASYFSQCENYINGLKDSLGKQDLPIYLVLGNHDLYNNGFDRWGKLNFSWNREASFFRFQTRVVSNTGHSYFRSWYFLDTASGMVGTKQMASLTAAMKDDENPKIVFSHYPIYIGKNFSTSFKLSDPRERATLINLFDKNKVNMVFSGHWHEGGTFNFGNFSELCCASFVENSKGESSWYLLTLSEEDSLLTVKEFMAEGRSISSNTFIYPL